MFPHTLSARWLLPCFPPKSSCTYHEDCGTSRQISTLVASSCQMTWGETQVVTLHTRWSYKVFAGFGARPFGYSVGAGPHRVMEGFMDFPQGSPSWSFLLILLLSLLLSIIFKIKLALGPLGLLTKVKSDEEDRLSRRREYPNSFQGYVCCWKVFIASLLPYSWWSSDFVF